MGDNIELLIHATSIFFDKNKTYIKFYHFSCT